jgi:predicted nuclease of predicted toxin-antitoxin system
MKLLIDECLSPVLAEEAHAAGFEAYHVAHHGWRSLKDPQLYRKILEEELILVTNNRDDFLQLIGAQELHPGLIVILENVRRDRQVDYFRAALEILKSMTDMINKVIEVASDGSVTVYDLPRGS